MIRNIIFDLDGTLCNSLPSIERSARIAAARIVPERPAPELGNLVGPPIAEMFARLWPTLPPEKMAALLAEFRAVYDSVGCVEAPLYPGVAPRLASFHEAGLRLFVLTNKPEKPARAILDHHGLSRLFIEILSPDSTPPFLRKPEGARSLSARHRLLPAETALVGDGQDDLDSALHCGFAFIHARYGYGRLRHPEPECLARLEIFSNLERILHSLSQSPL